MSLGWYINRLKAMPPKEILYRIGRKIFALKIKRQFCPKVPQQIFESTFPFINIDKDEIRKFISDAGLREIYLSEADKILEGKIPVFHCDDLVFKDGINWHIDPISKLSWDKDFYSNIHYQTYKEDFGGIRFVWELNRHLHFLTLGQAYLISGDEKFAKEICDEFQSWAMQNPAYFGVNWISPLEFAIRIINWLWAFSFIKGSPHFTKEIEKELLEFTYLQTDFTYHNLALYSSANNHLIGEAMQLAVVGMMFDKFPEAQKWEKRGFEILKEEMKNQIYSDGVGKEQAISYLAFVIDFYLQTDFFAKQKGLDSPVDLKQFENSLEFIKSLMNASGDVPQIGDSDDGFAFKCWTGDFNNYQSLLNTFAVICDRADFKKAGSEIFDIKSYYLLDSGGLDKYNNLSDQKNIPELSKAFNEGGYYVMKSGAGENEKLLVFDCGEIGYLSLAAHGHADCLSVMLSYSGEWMLGDSGTYLYHDGGKWRDYFRSTYAHNSVVIDGQNQSEIKGPFVWSGKAQPKLLNWDVQPNLVKAEGQHDGYFPIIHKRSVEFHNNDFWIITDTIEGEGRHKIEVVYNFTQGDAQIMDDKSVRFVKQNSNKSLIISLENNSENIHADIFKGQEEGRILGWASQEFGVKYPIPVLIYSIETQLPFSITTKLQCIETN